MTKKPKNESEQKKVKVSIPAPLFEKVKEQIKGTEFNSVDDYVTYVLEGLTSEKTGREESLSKEDEEQVKARLRALGYID